MRNVNLNPLVENDIEFKKISLVVEEGFKCNWEDAVHDSYGVYVDQLSKRSESLHRIRSNAEAIVDSVDKLCIDRLIKEAETLCAEADSI